MIEVVAQAYGEEEATIQTMFQRRHANRLGLVISPGEEKASDEGQNDSDPVSKDNVHEGKARGAQHNQKRSCLEKLAIAGEEEDSVNEALWQNRKQGIQEHY